MYKINVLSTSNTEWEVPKSGNKEGKKKGGEAGEGREERRRGGGVVRARGGGREEEINQLIISWACYRSLLTLSFSCYIFLYYSSAKIYYSSSKIPVLQVIPSKADLKAELL